jgi:TetR/AcrR family transcriptional regulator, transcriptional repressor for nem operon
MPRTKEFDQADVLEKAQNLFWRKGYEATSMQDIVDTLGISRSSIYDSFGDKHNLYCTVLELFYEENALEFSKNVKNTQTPLKMITDLFEGIVESVKTDKERKGCFMVNASIELMNDDPIVKDIILKNNSNFEKALIYLLKQGQALGEIKSKTDPAVLAKFLYNNIVGMKVAIRNGSNTKDLSAISNMTLSMLHS